MPISNLREFRAPDTRWRGAVAALGVTLLLTAVILELWALLDDRTTTVSTRAGVVTRVVEAPTASPGLVAVCLALGTACVLAAAFLGGPALPEESDQWPAEQFALAPQTLTQVAQCAADLVGTAPEPFATVFAGAVEILLLSDVPDPDAKDRRQRVTALIQRAVAQAAADAGLDVPVPR